MTTAMAAQGATAYPELVLTREFAAPQPLVWAAWTDPALLARWWGPEGFTNPVCEADVRPGGALRIVMRGPDGTDYPMTGVFHEVEAPERLVFTSTVDDGAEVHFDVLTSVTLAARGDGTLLTLRARVLSATDAAAPYLAGMEMGWTQSLERLGREMAGGGGPRTGGGAMSESATHVVYEPAAREIVLTRHFDAPPALVWEAWTRPEHIGRWWGPNGFTTTTEAMDVRPGGTWTFMMHGPDGRDYPNHIEYEIVEPPQRLVYANGTAAGEPPLFHATVTFTADDGGTTVTLRLVFPTAEARDYVVREHGALEGGQQTLARLADHLATLRG